MKALYYSAHPDLPLSGHAGYSTHMRGMIGGLEANGASVIPIVAGENAPNVASPSRTDEDSGLRSIVRRSAGSRAWNGLRDLRLIRADHTGTKALSERLQAGGIDLVYERHTHLHRGGVRAAHKHGVSHVLEVNSPPDERATLGGVSPLDRLGRHRVLSSLRSTTIPVFVSSALRDLYQELLGEEIGHSLVIPNAVARPSIGAPPTVSDASPVIVGFVGSLLEWHGIDLLISAFADVHKSRPGTVLKIVGDGELRSTYEDMAADRGLSDAITFVGRVEHAEALRQVESFDIAVMVQSNSYGSPVKLFEYAAKGCAIIAPDVSPAHEVLEDGREALFVAPRQKSIHDALVRLIDDPGLRLSLGREAQQRIANEFTWEQAAAKVLAHLEDHRYANG